MDALTALPALAASERADYASARPFPHAVLDGALPEKLLRAVLSELPERAEGRGCVRGSTACFWRRDDELYKSVVDVEADEALHAHARRRAQVALVPPLPRAAHGHACLNPGPRVLRVRPALYRARRQAGHPL
ncbi:hypothetical protein M885DRAFT_506589 [Pelagophyceae sp. CCMP2097]|nr:hypothetical protein M885DRAFT_506589 [Pelagophyceae sp. CCMP2097]